MGFVDRFYSNANPKTATKRNRPSSFEQITDAELEAHLEIGQYGSFQLTNAIRPSYDLKIVPRQGYRFDTYHDEEANTRVPVLMASATSEVLFDLFIELLEPLGRQLDVVMESSHHNGRNHQDLYREHIDIPVLKKHLVGFRRLVAQRWLHWDGRVESKHPPRGPVRRAQAAHRLRQPARAV